MSGSICKGCGNTGKDINGEPCCCQMSDEVRHLVFNLRNHLDIETEHSEHLKKLLAASWYINDKTPCRYPKGHDFCVEHMHTRPCIFEQIANELKDEK